LLTNCSIFDFFGMIDFFATTDLQETVCKIMTKVSRIIRKFDEKNAEIIVLKPFRKVIALYVWSRSVIFLIPQNKILIERLIAVSTLLCRFRRNLGIKLTCEDIHEIMEKRRNCCIHVWWLLWSRRWTINVKCFYYLLDKL